MITQAANQGETRAMAILGLCHLEGKGMAKDKMKALSLIREAVEKKDSMAQGVLGLCYRRGLGVKKDAKRAVESAHQVC